MAGSWDKPSGDTCRYKMTLSKLGDRDVGDDFGDVSVGTNVGRFLWLDIKNNYK